MLCDGWRHLSCLRVTKLSPRRPQEFPNPFCLHGPFIYHLMYFSMVDIILFSVCLGASGSPQSGRRSDTAPDQGLARRELTYAAPPRRDQEEEEHFVPTAPSVLHMAHKRHQVSSNGHHTQHSPGDQHTGHERAETTPAPMVPARMDSAREQMEKSKASQVCRRMCYYSIKNV